jgi:hypothetical protein
MSAISATAVSEAPAAPEPAIRASVGSKVLAWLVVVGGLIYFFTPLFATGQRSFFAIRDTFGFEAYRRILTDPTFLDTFTLSVVKRGPHDRSFVGRDSSDRLLGGASNAPTAFGDRIHHAAPVRHPCGGAGVWAPADVWAAAVVASQ